MTPLIRLALGLASPAIRSQAWRTVLVLVLTSVGTIGLAGSASVWRVLERQWSAIDDRSLVAGPATDPSAWAVLRSDATARGQLALLFLESEDTAVWAAYGFRTPPSPGTFAVSPAVQHEMDRDAGLMARFGGSAVELPDFVLIEPDELFAVGRPPAGVDLASSPSAIPLSAVGGRGQDPGGALAPPRMESALAIALLLIVPSLWLLVTASRIDPPLRDRQVDLLARLGVSQGRLRVMTSVEAGAAAAPGVALGAVLWWSLTPHMSAVPLVRAPVFPGSLQPGLPVLASLGALSVLIVALCSARSTTQRGSRISLVAGKRVAWLARWVLWCSIALYVASLWFERDAQLSVLLVGIVLGAVAVPLVLPSWVSSVGRIIARRGTGIAWLTGRDLAHRAPVWAGSLAALTAALCVSLPALAFLGLIRADAPARPADLTVAAVTAHGPTRAVAAVLQQQLPAAAVVVVTHMEPERVIVSASCEALRSALAADDCAAAIGSALGVDVDVAPPEAGAEGDIVVLGRPAVVSVTDIRVAAASLPLAQVTDMGNRDEPESPLAPWFLGALLVAGALITVALVAGLADRVMSDRGRARTLASLGLPDIARLARAGSFLGAYAVAVLAGASMGSIAAAVVVRGSSLDAYPATTGLLVAAGIGMIAALGWAGLRWAPLPMSQEDDV